MNTWQPMATRPRRVRMTARDWIDAVLVVCVVILAAHAVGGWVPV